MKTSQALALPCAALVVLALSACGGGGGNTAVAPVPAASATTTISMADIARYMTDLLGMTSEASAPTDVNNVELSVDETAEPAAVN